MREAMRAEAGGMRAEVRLPAESPFGGPVTRSGHLPRIRAVKETSRAKALGPWPWEPSSCRDTNDYSDNQTKSLPIRQEKGERSKLVCERVETKRPKRTVRPRDLEVRYSQLTTTPLLCEDESCGETSIEDASRETVFVRDAFVFSRHPILAALLAACPCDPILATPSSPLFSPTSSHHPLKADTRWQVSGVHVI